MTFVYKDMLLIVLLQFFYTFFIRKKRPIRHWSKHWGMCPGRMTKDFCLNWGIKTLATTSSDIDHDWYEVEACPETGRTHWVWTFPDHVLRIPRNIQRRISRWLSSSWSHRSYRPSEWGFKCKCDLTGTLSSPRIKAMNTSENYIKA